MGERTVISLPFVQGMAQQEATEWLDSSASTAGVVNGNLSKHGSVDKRLGMAPLPSATIVGNNAPGLTVGVRVASWSRSGLSAAGNGYLYSYSGAQAGLVGHIEIGDGAVVAAQSGVSKSIRAGEQVFGSPATPVKNAFRNNAHIQRLDKYVETIKDLKKRIEELEKKSNIK